MKRSESAVGAHIFVRPLALLLMIVTVVDLTVPWKSSNFNDFLFSSH